MANDSINTLGLHLLEVSSKEIKEHLLSNKSGEWKSGFLNEVDTKEVESQTGKKIQCSVESGEYFYKI